MTKEKNTNVKEIFKKFYIFIIKPILIFLKKSWFILVPFLTYALTMYFLNLNSCLSKYLFGIPCPGCGLTRAGVAFLSFDFIKAFKMNPVIFLIPVAFLAVIYKDYWVFKILYNSKCFWIIIGLTGIISYIIRMSISYGTPPLDYYENNLLEIIKNAFSS